MDNFWCDIRYVEVDVIWLFKVKTHRDKLEKIQSKIERKKLRKVSANSLLKKMVLERFDERFPFFKFKFDFNAFCYSKFPDFENLYTLPIINKGRSAFRTCNSSQASQDGFTVRDFVKPEGGQNEIISSAEKAPDIQ